MLAIICVRAVCCSNLAQCVFILLDWPHDSAVTTDKQMNANIFQIQMLIYSLYKSWAGHDVGKTSVCININCQAQVRVHIHISLSLQTPKKMNLYLC